MRSSTVDSLDELQAVALLHDSDLEARRRA